MNNILNSNGVDLSSLHNYSSILELLEEEDNKDNKDQIMFNFRRKVK